MKFNQLPYERPDFEVLKDKLEEVISALKEAGDFDKFWSAYEIYREEVKEVYTLFALAFIRNSIDTRDEFYDAEKKFMFSISPELEGFANRVQKILVDSPYRDEITAKIGSYFFDKVEVSLKTFSEEVVEDMKEENLLAMEYQKLLSSAKINYDGEEKTLSQLLPYMQSPNRDIRKEASELYYGFMGDNQEAFDTIYDKLVKVRDRIAKKLGYKNFVELGYYRMGRTDYNAQDVARYREFILEEVVPLSNELREKQKNRLGLSDFNYYDLNFEFPSGNAKPIGSKDDIMVEALKMYNELSPETSKFFRMMVDNDLLDLEAKAGKSPGGYCHYLAKYEYPFIFSNFNGTQHDVEVLTHEVGHAFQKYCSRDLPPELLHGTKETAEIHSMSMEFLTYPWMKSFFGEDIDKFEFSHLQSAILFLPYGASVDEFQHYVYENPHISPEERRLAWRRIEKKYTPYKNYSDNQYLEDGGYWQRQMHIYRSPFYYIDYTLAQVCALQYFKRSNENPKETWESYVKLCTLGGSKAFTDLLKEVNLDSPFEAGVLKGIVGFVREKLEAIDDSKF